MSEDATRAPVENTAATPEPASDGRANVRAAILVFALAAGFALVPRATKGCNKAALEEDAPNFAARVVANAENIGPVSAGEAGDARAGDARASDARASDARVTNARADDARATTTKLELHSLRGRPVVLDFWATWCGPCQAEAPIVNTIAQRYKDKGLAVVGVNTSDEDGLAERFVRKKGLAFPVVYDEDNTIAKQYGVSSLPTLIVISKTGKIVAVRNGVTSDSALDEIVRRYL